MGNRTRRVLAIIAACGVLAAVAAVTIWNAKRTVRWNDARTMPPPLEAAVRAYAKGDAEAGLESVHLLLRRYRAPSWEARARVLAAARLARDGRYREILDALPRDLAPDDPLATHALLLRARGLLARDLPGRAATLAATAAAIPGFPAAEEARLIHAEALETAGAWREALRALDATPTCATAIAAGRMAAARGDRDGARRRLSVALLQTESDDDFERLREAFEAIVPETVARFTPSERPQLAQRGRRWLDDGRARSAVHLLRLARPAGAPSAATGPEALVEAEALLKLGRIEEMRPLLARARQEDSESRDGAAYLEARRAASAGRLAAYRAGLEMLARRGARPWRERALLDLAKSSEGAPSVRTLEAYRRYRLAAGAGADPLALLREGWAAYELGRNSDAKDCFLRALARVDSPDGVRVTATYWLARLADAAGRTVEARERYAGLAGSFANHYYGTLAAKRLGRAVPSSPDGLRPVDDPGVLGSAGRWLAAARALTSVGLWDEAAPCYRTALDEAGTSRPDVALEAAMTARAAAALSDAIGFAQNAVGDRDRAAAERIPRQLWRLLYPAPFADALTRAARGTGLDPHVVAAVALQESAFNPLAVSSAGARGLLQVMPSVGAELARSAGLPRFDPSDLFDPETNLKLGCAHLRDYLNRFKSIPRALGAYNGGPSRVERWILPTGKDDERFVERIPIPETRLYVKRVLASSRMYEIAWPRGLGVD